MIVSQLFCNYWDWETCGGIFSYFATKVTVEHFAMEEFNDLLRKNFNKGWSWLTSPCQFWTGQWKRLGQPRKLRLREWWFATPWLFSLESSVWTDIAGHKVIFIASECFEVILRVLLNFWLFSLCTTGYLCLFVVVETIFWVNIRIGLALNMTPRSSRHPLKCK